MTAVAEYRDRHQLTAADVRGHVNLIQEVMQAVMKEDVHFGKIPGTDKPTLLKPGAEKICETFRIAPSYQIEDLSGKGFVRYRIRCVGTHQTTSIVLGEGMGECSSLEEKYKWRKAASFAEFDATPEDKRRIKYGYNRSERKEYEIKQVRAECADQANTILKMACKRALVAMTLTVTAASDLFTQDIEDLPEELRPEGEPPEQPKVAQPRAKSEKPAPAADQAKPAAEAAPKPAATGDHPLSDGQQRILRARMESAKVDAEQLKKRFGDELPKLPASQFNAISAWVREMAEARA